MIPLFIFAFGTSSFILTGFAVVTFAWMALLEYVEVMAVQVDRDITPTPPRW
jgi:hypothetical protein